MAVTRRSIFFHSCGVLWHAVKAYNIDQRLYFPSAKGVLRIFITLKIHRTRPGLNRRTLGPVDRARVITGSYRSHFHIEFNERSLSAFVSASRLTLKALQSYFVSVSSGLRVRIRMELVNCYLFFHYASFSFRTNYNFAVQREWMFITYTLQK
jgi:hypothetical protein